MTDLEGMHARLKQLEADVDVLRSKEQIVALQYSYGYFLDTRLWREISELFTEDGELEIGRRGVYRGKARIERFLTEVLGEDRTGLLAGELLNHMQLQPIVTISANTDRANIRARTEIIGGSPPGTDKVLWAEGVYDATVVREAGVWRYESLYWAPTFYTLVPGFDQAWFTSSPSSEAFPPDRPGRALHPRLGRNTADFPYPHPVTGAPIRDIASQE